MMLVANLIVSLLLALKTAEMVFHCYAIMASWDVRSVGLAWPVTRAVQRVRLTHVFRLPVLVLLSSLLLSNGGGTPWFDVVGAAIVLCSIWVNLFQALLSCFAFGSSDIGFRRLSVVGWIDGTGQTPRPSKHHAARDLVLFTGGFAIVAILGYAGVYAVLRRVDLCAFTGSRIDSFLDCLYFSVITFATVGYGDISPLSSLARTLAVSEIFVSMGSLVLLVLAYSMVMNNGKGGPEA